MKTQSRKRPDLLEEPGRSRASYYRDKKRSQLYPALVKEWSGLAETFCPAVPDAEFRETRFQVARAFRDVFGKAGKGDNTPGEMRRQLKRFARCLAAARSSYLAMGPDARCSARTLFAVTAGDDDFDASGFLATLAEFGGEFGRRVDEAGPNTYRGSGGPSMDSRIPELATRLVDIYRQATGETPTFWLARDDTAGSGLVKFAEAALNHFAHELSGSLPSLHRALRQDLELFDYSQTHSSPQS